MNLATVIDIAAACLGLFAGVFFAVGVLNVENSTLETIATSMWEKGQTIAKELALQKVDFTFGAALLVLSFLVQVAGKCLPADVALSVVATSTLCGAVAGVVGPLTFVAVLLIPYFQCRARATKRLSAAIEGKV
jgi:hypothetical protein